MKMKNYDRPEVQKIITYFYAGIINADEPICIDDYVTRRGNDNGE